MPRKHPVTQVDRILGLCSAEDAANFRRRGRYWSGPDIARELDRLRDEYRRKSPPVELPDTPSHDAIANWYNQTYPTGVEAVSANDVAANYQGIEDPLARAEMSLNILTRLVSRLFESLEGRQLDTVDTNLLHQVFNLLKEQRTAALAIHDAKRLGDRKLSELAGGYRVVEIARTLAREMPQQEAIIRDTLNAAIAQLEQEVNG